MNKANTIGYLLLLLIATDCYGQKADYDYVVAKDGSGDFTEVQKAILAVPDFRDEETVIFIKKGTYKEKIVLPKSKTNVTFIGEAVEETILTYNDFASKKNRFGEELGTTGSSSFFLFGDNFTARNITFENSSGDVGQAVALRVDGDKAVFVNCRFLGFQDTLYTHAEDSRQYYKDSYIEGATDFIFGASTAVFDNCEIYCKKGGSYLTAASTPEEKEFGHIIMNSRITGNAPEGSFFLGRPWRPHARVVVMNSYLGSVVKPEGWHNWGEPEREETVLYAEYNNEGPGNQPETRVPWSRQLTEDEAEKYSLITIFDGWDPSERIK